MNDPLVSFVIPTFNRPVYLAAALESVFAQEDYPNKEIIVVDDGSTENMREACARFPVLYLRQENRGPSAAYNLGASRIRGTLLVFMDDDDLCPPGSLRVRVDHWLQDQECHHVVGRLRRFREDVSGRFEFIDSEEQSGHIMCVGPDVMLRSAFEQVGGFNESLRMSEDVDLWMRMREAGLRQKLIPEICLHNRMHPGKLTEQSHQSTQHGFINALRMRIQRARGA